MTDLAPLIFRHLYKQILRIRDGFPCGREALNTPSDDPDAVCNWVIDQVRRLDLPGVRVYTGELDVRPHLVLRSISETDDATFLGIEIISLELGPDGKDPVGIKLDYGPLPPCGVFKTEWADGKHLFIKGYYLFILLDRAPGAVAGRIRTLVMCDGDFLNDDIGYFLQEEKACKPRSGQGPYGDGLIERSSNYYFPNLLHSEITELAGQVTLIHPSEELNTQLDDLARLHVVDRVRLDGSAARFYLYRYRNGEEDTLTPSSKVDLFHGMRHGEPPLQPQRRFILRD